MHGWYAAARIAGTKGLEGKLRLKDASAFLRYASKGTEVAFVPPAEDVVRFAKVLSVEEVRDDSCLATFSGVASAGDGQALVGRTVLVAGEAPDDLEDADSLGWLRGFVVEDASSGVVGIVEDVDDGPNRFQPLLSVRQEGREASVLIPFVDELVDQVDEEGKRILMTLPVGILDI